ncbi:O-antigen ligase family protein [Ectopseudomonas mendocina]|uniref:O-antigen ligase family protein n=1 Tax=Ectopseudomonas mendocina TaxID=300 RepID=UPI0023ED263B|nr:O-antigen ligase family protein [Pseudomonas mendocina]
MPLALGVWSRNTSNFISEWILPIGYFCLLTGLAWLGDHSQYHKLFYALIALPALIATVMQPKLLASQLREPVTFFFAAFSAWALISISWSGTEDSFASLAKRPLYIFMLFTACALMAQRDGSRLLSVLSLASVAIVPIAVYALVDFAIHYTPGARLIGSGALDNPLLSSHLFGLFCMIWLGWVMTSSTRHSSFALVPLAVLSLTLLTTGSRTPIVAAALASIWLMLCCWNKRAVLLAAVGACGVVLLLLVYPESLLSRGTSYRLEIWQLALEQIRLQPWVGHGFDAHLALSVPGISYSFSEPHSFFLGVLYYTGVIGAIFWILMHGAALWTCWRRRSDLYFIIAGALVVYGLGAGLAEGGGILSRPKEHWFLTWIPLALVAALSIGRKQEHSL